MKQIYLLRILLLITFYTNAQVQVQGIMRYDIKQNSITKTQLNKTQANTANFDDIKYWVGEGANKAAFVVQWNDGKNSDALLWGFRWDGTATGEDMIKAIAKADPRFFILNYYSGASLGSAIGGIGFDLDGKGTNGLYVKGDITYPKYPVGGVVNTKAYDFDDYTGIDANDHWQSGWNEKGYWSYYVKNNTTSDYDYGAEGASNRQLANGSWDVWNYNVAFETIDIASTFTPVSAYVPTTDFTNGYFIVNEEWFGHTNGSLNFVDSQGNIDYRVYSSINNNEAFGTTTTGGTIYGDKIYFVSKQAADGGDTQYTPGGRLVVADAKSLKKIATFNTIGGGDGRSFIGVDQNTGYIGASNGVYTFDIANLKVGNLITGTSGKGQIGNMIRTSQYVFVVTQSKGILVIDPITNTVITTITGTFHSVVQAKDGSVWGIQGKKLINIDALTFALKEYAIPTTQYLGSWGAWNAGSFTYSNQENALYWMNSVNSFTSGAKIIKFDIASKTFNEDFAILPGQTGTYKQIPYGAGLRLDPISDAIIVNTTESGYGAHYQKNWIHTFDAKGGLTDTKILNDYYWFPSVTVFPDNAAPVVNATLPAEISLNSATIIDLKTVVSDADNLSMAIVKSLTSNSNLAVVSATINANDELVLAPLSAGDANIIVSFNSNGKIVEKSIAVTVTGSLGTNQFNKLELAIYPNPVADILNIKTQDEVLNVAVYDALGKSIPTNVINNQIDVSGFAKGLYIITITTDTANYQQKFIKN